MTILTMSHNEIERLELISQIADKRITQLHVSQILGLSIRQVQRLVNNYRAFGAEGLLSKRRGKRSNRAYPQALREHAMALVHAYYRVTD